MLADRLMRATNQFPVLVEPDSRVGRVEQFDLHLVFARQTQPGGPVLRQHHGLAFDLPVILPAKHTSQVFAELDADRLPGRVFRLLRVRTADELNVKSDLLGLSCLNREIAKACQKQ